MNIGLGVLGQSIVDDMGQVHDIDASCCDIGCCEDVYLLLPELVKDLFPFLLGKVSMKGIG
ncbi:hypothetical protein SDC9_182122 [bioreactor metagenome]|uniref:Uncharacterized protein n=1 Tax=bioreactor metagenome TaxID=1076179 RepID=A0A645H6L7_9ZZZZ